MHIFRNTTSKKLHLFRSLDTLKILTFWKILKEKNALLLDMDYFEEKKYSNEQKNEIEQTWNRLYDEFFVLRDSSKSRMQLIRAFDEMHLREKITQIKNNADFLIELKSLYGLMPQEDLDRYEQEIYNTLKLIDKKIKPLYFEGIDANIRNLERIMNSFINKYNQEHKKRDEAVKTEINNVYDIVANAESWLERNININDMVVAHWLAIEKQVEQKRQSQIKKKNGTK